MGVTLRPIGGGGGGGGVTDHFLLTNIGVLTHVQLDAHVADTTIHFTVASIDHTAILNIGTNSHAAIDTHIADGTIHFTEASIDHTAISNIGVNTHAQIDTHVADGTIHFTEGSIDHTNIGSIGVNSHAVIDGHIGDATIHFTEASIDHTAITNIGVNSHLAIDSHIADGTIHFTEGSIDHGNLQGLADDDHVQYLLIDGTRAMTGDLEFATGGEAVIYNSFLDGDIHFDVNNSASGVNTRAMTITSEHPTQGASAIDLRPSDSVFLSNFIFMQQNLEIVNSESAFGSSVQLRLDNAAPLTAIRQFGVTTTDPGFGSMTMALGGPALPNSFLFQGAFDALFSIASGQVFEFDGPMLLTDTLSLTHQNNILLDDTFTTGGGFNGGGIRSTGTITYNNGFFIWGLMVEQKTYRALVNPGFAAFTLFNALPTIENAGNFNLVSALVLNVGIKHQRTTAGTSTTVGTTGMNFSPSASAAISGGVMTKTSGDTAVLVAPKHSTVAGSTINHGTIRGMQFSEPAGAIFQPVAGTENMTAYLGIDFPNITFGGVNRIVEVVRSALNVGTNVRFLNHTGTAESQFGGHIHLDDLVTLKLGGTNAVFDAGVLWLPANNALTLSGGRTRVQGAMEYPPINPVALGAGNNNDWVGLLTNAVSGLMRHWARISGNATTSVITGINATAAEDGDTFKMTNVSANSIDIGHQDVASVAANRIISPSAATYQLGPDESCEIIYDATTARWRILWGSGA